LDLNHDRIHPNSTPRNETLPEQGAISWVRLVLPQIINGCRHDRVEEGQAPVGDESAALHGFVLEDRTLVCYEVCIE